eukprot:TRINITY_DN4153_c0_g1_i9.p2 TRINITY_DN4153_c0_g1~~TRINITY_DN4153_c0_g1_i9.p2  ORF type:complete len:108 (+),score=1.49 TRINITY_DN4153_c0_g1_i9:45-326(+)
MVYNYDIWQNIGQLMSSFLGSFMVILQTKKNSIQNVYAKSVAQFICSIFCEGSIQTSLHKQETYYALQIVWYYMAYGQQGIESVRQNLNDLGH